MRPIVFALLVLSGCAALVPAYRPPDMAAAQAQANASVDGAMVQRVSAARAAAQAGGPDGAWRFSKELEAAYGAGTVARGALDGPPLVAEAARYLDAAATGDERGKLLSAKGSLLAAAGDRAGAKAALEAAFTPPSLWPVRDLLAVYDAEARADRVLETCKQARGLAKTDDERMAVLEHCVVHQHAASVEAALAWAPKGDLEFYRATRAQDEAKAAQENAAWRQKQDADRAALAASFSKPGQDKPASSSGSPGGSASSVSVQLRSACARTVRVFYGKTPKFGSGTTSRISSNEVSNKTFQPGDMMWVVDDADNGLSSVTVSSSTREITVGPDCRSLSAR